jgi:endonuclease/exonuclease/phosphatase family metal-dependent hydrolase
MSATIAITEAQAMEITIGTANIAGAARQEQADPGKHSLLARILGVTDVLGLQEVVRAEDPVTGQLVHDDIAALKSNGLSDYKHFFFAHLDSMLHPHRRKWGSDIFKDWMERNYRIQQGTAILIKGRHDFYHLLENDRPGSASAVTIPWYIETPTFYQGNRDTEPRSLLVARVKIGSRVVLFCCTQLSTLTEEAEDRRRSTPNARALRSHQIGWTVDYIKSYQEARQEICNELKQEWFDDPVILVGDFNADKSAPELSRLSELGLRVTEATGPSHTHRTHEIEMDLIFAPESMHKSAQIIEVDMSESSKERRISDHYPVIATLNI